jgi:acyl-CoA synthetase (AMP-forming)/AMP-acid ligase II
MVFQNTKSNQSLIFKHAGFASWFERIDKNAALPAILAPGQSPLTYEGLKKHINAFIKTLRGLGVSRKHRVALISPNGPEMASAFISVISCAACAPLNPAYKKEEYDFYLTDLKADAIIIHSHLDSPVREVAREKKIPIIELIPTNDRCAGGFDLKGEPFAVASKDGVPEPEDTALILHTSGTTSRPKMVPLFQKNIFASAYNIGKTLHLCSQDRCLNVMPLFHIHGLMAALLASFNVFSSVVCTPGFRDDSFFSWVNELHPTWYTAVPTIHQSVLQLAEANPEMVESVNFRLIRSSSSSLPPQVMNRLETIFNVPVIEAYGMSEAAHQMTSNLLPPKVRKPGSVGAAAGPDVAIMDEKGNLLPKEKTGEVVIRGENVMREYENNTEANNKAFSQGWFHTGDQGYFDGDGYLFLTGRLKELINRGGQKISPREIDEVLMDHPSVSQAVAFAIPHPRLGEAVGTAVVLKKGETISEQELRRFAAERLAPYKVPQQIVFLDRIPRGATGKLQRIGLADTLSHLLKPEYIAPRNEMEKELAGIWSEVLGVKPIGIYDNFFAKGGDSLLAARVRSGILQKFQIDLPIGTLFHNPTLKALAEVLAQYRAKTITDETLLNLLSKVEDLSEDEAQQLLDE